MNIVHYNSKAWDRQVDQNNEWTRPVDRQQIEAACRGEWEVVLTPVRPVPKNWFGELDGKRVLCLASGGGQQAPILAAAGAKVSLLDNSARQLEQDRNVAQANQLELELVQGDMADLSGFPEGHFDLIFNPCSICFSPEPRQVWRECRRVIRPGGRLLTGLTNPALYLFDDRALLEGRYEVAYSIPYSDKRDLPDDQKQAFLDSGEPFSHGHSWNELLGGLTEAGFWLADLFEDGFGDDGYAHVNEKFKAFLAVVAVAADPL